MSDWHLLRVRIYVFGFFFFFFFWRAQKINNSFVVLKKKKRERKRKKKYGEVREPSQRFKIGSKNYIRYYSFARMTCKIQNKYLGGKKSPKNGKNNGGGRVWHFEFLLREWVAYNFFSISPILTFDLINRAKRLKKLKLCLFKRFQNLYKAYRNYFESLYIRYWFPCLSLNPLNLSCRFIKINWETWWSLQRNRGRT